MALLSNITKEQVETLGNFFQTMKKMNEAADLVRSTGRTGGRAEGLDAATKAHDAALAAVVAAFEPDK